MSELIVAKPGTIRRLDEDPIEILVAPMAHIETLSLEQTLVSIADVCRAQRRTFCTLGKCLVHLQHCLPADQVGAALRARGIAPSALSNASYAARVWNQAVATGLLTEAEFDELTFAACVRVCRALGGGRHLRAEAVRIAIEDAAREDDAAPTLDLEDSSVAVHPRGVRISGKLTWEEYFALLGKWKDCKDGWHFGLSDLLLYGRTHFGHGDVAGAMEQLGFPRSDASTAAAIESVPEKVRARPEITADHIRAVAKGAPNLAPKDQGKWLEKAADKGLAPLDLRRSLQQGKIVRGSDVAKESGRASGLATIEGIRFEFDGWQRRVEEAEGPIIEWEEFRLRLLLAELAGMHALYEAIAKTLP